MKKAAFFDIDGTLIDVTVGMTEPSARVRAALQKLKDAGHYIFISSGRPLDFLDPAIIDVGFNGFVLMNGAVVVIDGKVIFDEPMAPNLVNEIVDFCDAHGVEYVLESHPNVYLKKISPMMEEFYARIDIDTNEFVREFDTRKISVNKIDFLIKEPNDEIRNFFNRHLQSEELTGIIPFGEKSVELYNRRNTKGSGILHALEYLGIPIENSFAFGDGFNDLEMIRAVGCGCAMGNGNPKLKAIAKHTVPSVREDGVAFGIEKYILEAAI